MEFLPVDVAKQQTRANHLLGALIAGLATAGSAANSFTDGEHQSFHFTNEGWFGGHTYADGADKTSHFVMYASRLNSSRSALMARMPALTGVALIAVCVIRAVS
jgi:hypothetical protein